MNRWQPMPGQAISGQHSQTDSQPTTTGHATQRESLPFVVRAARGAEDFAKVLDIRSSAYARHLPEFGRTLRQAEDLDSAPGVIVLLAESKLDGAALGTMRIQTNRHAPLMLEQSITLPEALTNSSLAEATRLAVVNNKLGGIVKVALFKSYFLFCQTLKIDWMVIAGRSPIDRQYRQLLFDDVFPELGYIPLRHVNNIPHRIMSFEMASVHARWETTCHPLYDFIFGTTHDDIDIGTPLSALCTMTLPLEPV
jgi:hypothetical protein